MENKYKNYGDTLFQKDFLLVVIGQIISLFGNAILRFALPLYLLRETGSSTLYGSISAVATVPMLIFTLLGGVVADRANKSRIMVVLDFLTAGLILGYQLLLGHISFVPLMMVCLILLYSISGFYGPSVQASIPLLLNNTLAIRGYGIVNMVNNLSCLLGPVLGGMIFGFAGIRPVLVISCLCFFLSAVMELFIHIPYQKVQKNRNMLVTIMTDLRESWNFIFHEERSIFRTLALFAFINLTSVGLYSVGIPVVITATLGLTDSHLGYLNGAMGLGGLLGGLDTSALASRINVEKSYLLLIANVIATAGLGIALLPFASSYGFLIMLFFGFLNNFVNAVFNIRVTAAIQAKTTKELTGKIMAFVSVVCGCMQPVSLTIHGILFDKLISCPYVIFFGGGMICFVLALNARKLLKQLV